MINKQDKNQIRVVGIHAGKDSLYNYGTYIKSITYEGLGEKFCKDDIDNYNLFILNTVSE